jgi:uncharacterized protein
METKNSSLTLPAVIISLGFVLSTLVGGGIFYTTRALNDVLSVTGSAKQDILSDRVKWVVAFSRPTTASGLKTAYKTMDADLNFVKQFYADKKIDVSTLVITPIYMEEIYEQNQGAEKRYNLRQTVELRSEDVEGITALAKNIQPLIEKGVILSTQNLEYSYTKLPELRVSLLSEAVTDARARANELVSGSGKTIGKLKSASSGVVQVMSLGSNDVSDYGSYDTSNPKKTVMVTVKASFTLK